MSRVVLAAFAALLFLPIAAPADTPEPGPWNFGVVTTLNLAQSAFSDNWAGGDKGALNWVLSMDADAKRQFTPGFHWSNQLQLAYGETSTQETTDEGKKVWTRPDKTTDKILFESVGRWTLGIQIDPYAALRLDSQFLDQSQPAGDLLFSPAKVTESVGVAHAFVEEEEREVISRAGFGLRQSFGRRFTDATGDKTESFSTNDGGLEFQTDAKLPLAENRVLYTGKFRLFWPVFFDKSSDLEDFDTQSKAADPMHEAVADFWKAPDIDWQNTFSSEITSWLNVNLYLQLVYDKFDSAAKIEAPTTANLSALAAEIEGATRKAGQFKQTLGVGLTYRFL